jgi:MFS family permease
MSTLAAVRAPGVIRTLGLSSAARLPLSVMGVLLVLQARDLDMSYAFAGLATGAFTLGMAAGSPIMGRLVDGHGQTVVLTLSCLGASAAIIAIAQVPSTLPGLLIPLALVVGLAQPPVAACVRVNWTRMRFGADRDALFALDIATQQVCYIVGPALLLWLSESSGTSAALVASGILLAVTTTALALTPETRAVGPSPRSGRIAKSGALSDPGVRSVLAATAVLGVGFGALEIGIVAIAEESSDGVSLAVLFAVWAVGAMIGCLWWASKAGTWDHLSAARALLVATTASSLLFAVHLPDWLLVLNLIVSGVVISPILVILYGMMTDVSPADTLTEAYAWEVTGMAVGVALGTAASGLIVDHVSIGTVFIFGSAAVLATIVVLRRQVIAVRTTALEIP